MTGLLTSRPQQVPAAAPRQRSVFAGIVARCVRDQRRSPFTWGISLGLMSALEVAIYPSVEKTLGKALSGYPDALKEAFRIEEINTPAQFLNGEMYSLIIPLAIGFFAIRSATRPLVGHEERHWLDVVLTAPVARRTLVAGSFAASALLTLAILLVMSALVALAGVTFGAEIPVVDLLTAVAITWAFALVFAGLAVLCCGRLASWAGVTAISAGVLVTMYVVDITARIADALHDLGPTSVFHYYGSPLVDGFDPATFAGLTAVGVLLAVAGAILFDRRDVRG